MGQKVNPNGLRLGINRDWESHWYADKKDFGDFLNEDVEIRKYLEKTLNTKDCGLSHINIERVRKAVKISIFASQVAKVLGADGADLKVYQAALTKMLKKHDEKPSIEVVEIKNPDLDAVLVAKDIAKQIEDRGSSRIVQKKAIQRVMRAGALGCKTMCKGRLNGAEIARYEEYKEGALGLMTLRQVIDYAYIPAHTIYGVIGVKVWIALPENYKELRDRRPEPKFGRRPFRGPSNRGNNGFHSAPRSATPAVTPENKVNGETKGE